MLPELSKAKSPWAYVNGTPLGVMVPTSVPVVPLNLKR